MSDVARRYGVSRGLLQTWRRTAMRMAVDQGSVFVPLRIADEPSAAPVDPAADSAVATATGLIELEGHRPRYGCRACEGAVVQAPAAPRPIEGGLPTAALLAHRAAAKFAWHLPLHRQT